jgi:hypothetical protein
LRIGKPLPNSQFSILDSAAAAALLLGHLLPWAAHPTAALTRSGHELSISTNFTPGAGIFLNEWFLMPLWASAVLIALAAASRKRGLGRWVGLGLGLLVASLGLPAYPHLLTAYANPDYQLQFFLTLGAFALIGAIALRGPLRPLLRLILVVACAIASTVPLVGYFAVKPFIEALYRGPIGVGVGWWLTLLGVGLLLVSAGAKMSYRIAPKRRNQSSSLSSAANTDPH